MVVQGRNFRALIEKRGHNGVDFILAAITKSPIITSEPSLPFVKEIQPHIQKALAWGILAP